MYSGGVAAAATVVGEVVAEGVLARESCGEGIRSWSSGKACRLVRFTRGSGGCGLVDVPAGWKAMISLTAGEESRRMSAGPPTGSPW